MYTFGRLTTTLSSLTFLRALDERGRRHAPRLPWPLLLLRPMAAAAVLHLLHPMLHCCCSSPRRPHAVARRGACPGRRCRADRRDCGLGGACLGHCRHAWARGAPPRPLPPQGARARGSSPLAAITSVSVGTTTSSSTGAPRESTSPHRAQRRGGCG
jgi:hypothetical protein